MVLAVAILAMGAVLTRCEADKRTTLAEAFAQRPERERNLLVFDAARALLENHYYDSAFFATPAWRDLVTEWRGKSGDVDSPMLYVDVLDHFARQFPESHVGFRPPLPSRQTPLTEPTPGPGFEAPEIRRGHERLQVVADVMRGSPGERAGVAPGWLLLKDEIQVTPQGARYVAEFLALDPHVSRDAEKSGRVTIPSADIARQPEAPFAAVSRNVDFELEELPATSDFETRRLPGDITYVRFDLFESLDLVEKTISAIESAGHGGLILDLRGNPGGRMLHLQRVAGALLGSDAALGTRRDANSSSVMYPWRYLKPYQGPLAVLIGPATGSAAEITAAAVQDHERGLLIGRITNGSVVPAEWFELPDGGRMMVPVSDFMRVDGRRIEGVGVEPDVWILPSLADVRAGRDPALERAVTELRARE